MGGDPEYTMRPHQIPYDFYSAGVHCGQCSVHIPDPYFEKLNDKNSSEITRLEQRTKPNSSVTRLSCCVQVRPELNEMIVVVGNNESSAGEYFNGEQPDAF